MTISETADRIWAALCEMKESEGVVLKDAYCRRVTEILAAEEATVEIRPTPEPKLQRWLTEPITWDDINRGFIAAQARK